MYNPFQLEIHNEAEDEEILRVWRHHPITLIKPVVRTMAFVLIPALLMLFTGFSMFSNPWLFLLFLLIVVMVLTYAAYEWISWYGDVYVLTSYRIIDVVQEGFFHRNFSEASLDKIQDVTYEISGFFQTIFNFGDAVIQTAAATSQIKLEDVADPQGQALYVLQIYKKHQDEKGEETLTAEELIRLLSKHRKDLDNLAKAEREETVKQADARIKEIKKKVKKTPKRPKNKEDQTTKIPADPDAAA